MTDNSPGMPSAEIVGSATSEGAETDAVYIGAPDRVTRILVVAVVLALALVLGLSLSAALLVQRVQGPGNYLERDIGAFEDVVARNPQSSDAWGDYAATLIEGEEYAEARSVIERGRETLAFDDGRLSFEEARLAYSQGDESGAIQKADEAIERAAKYRAEELAKLEGKGLTESAMDVPVRALTEASILKGRIYAARGDDAEALDAYSAALIESPDAADILVVRGDLYVEMGDPASAEADYRAALRYVPTYEPAHEGLRKIGAESE